MTNHWTKTHPFSLPDGTHTDSYTGWLTCSRQYTALSLWFAFTLTFPFSFWSGYEIIMYELLQFVYAVIIVHVNTSEVFQRSPVFALISKVSYCAARHISQQRETCTHTHTLASTHTCYFLSCLFSLFSSLNERKSACAMQVPKKQW